MRIVPRTYGDIARFFAEIACIAFVGYAGWIAYPHQIRTVVSQAYQRVWPCGGPISYRIGSIDPRFDLATSQVETLLQNAAGKWNTASGKDVLAYDQQNGVVTVSFVYDERQETQSALSEAKSAVASGQGSYETLSAQYASAMSDYDSKKAAYQGAEATYEKNRGEYEQEVAEWNARGGAPQSVYDQLESMRTTLQSEQDDLNAQSAAINQEVDTINMLAKEINTQIDSLNLKIDKYNSIGASLGGTFEEGEFDSSFANESITIYEYDTATQLHRVLAHEFGHAIGLEHVQDPDAIMYAYNDSENERLTKSDIRELDQVCGL